MSPAELCVSGPPPERGRRDMNRAVLIGEPTPGGLTSALRHAFVDLQWDTLLVPWGAERPRLLGRLASRAPRAATPFRRRLRRSVDEIAATSVDLVVVVKGFLFDHPTIEYIRRRLATPVVCWNPDSPFDPATSNSGGGMTRTIGSYDHYVTWADDVAERLAPLARHVVVIPFGWDPRTHFPEPGSGKARDRVVFIGTWTAERQRWLEALAPWEPLVFGNSWPRVPGVELRPAVTGSEFRQVVGEARCNLNFLRPQNRASHNMRTFEIPACAGRQLAQRSPDHERFLRTNDAALFDDVEELRCVLEQSPPNLQPNRSGAFSEHTYARRVAQLLGHLGLEPERASR